MGWIVNHAAAFIAGFAILSIQIVFVRVANHLLGAEPSTLALVVSVSIIGLAGGSVFWSRTSQRIGAGNMLVAASFTSAAIYCVILSSWMDPIGGWAERFSDWGSGWAGVFFAAICVFPINFLMGGAVPLLANVSSGDARSAVSFPFIYAFETMGAAFGAIFTGFFAIPVYGLTKIVFFSGVLLGIPGILFCGGRSSFRVGGSNLHTSDCIKKELNSDSIWLIVVLFAGATSMGMEIIFHRFLSYCSGLIRIVFQ